jgi:hypothetical protein
MTGRLRLRRLTLWASALRSWRDNDGLLGRGLENLHLRGGAVDALERTLDGHFDLPSGDGDSKE